MIVALDIETTGLDKNKDKIIEIALVKFDENTFEIIETFESLVNPMIPIPDIVSEITGITDEIVAQAPKITDLLEKINNFIGDYPILGHNTNFDRDFLIASGAKIEKNIVLDTFFLANMLIRGEKSLSLESLSDYLEIGDYKAHRALNDAINTVKLFSSLITKIRHKSKEKKSIINYFFGKTKDKNIIRLKDYLALGETEKLDEEKIIKKIKKIVKKAPKLEDIKFDDTVLLDFNESYFSKFPNFEIRENQKKMALEVIDSLQNNKKILIEAPTGVGKTFAYLLPSILYSIKTGERVFISTSSKALQDQIIYKDLSFFIANLGFNFSYTKLKGKRNYISIFNFINTLSENQFLDKDELGFFVKVFLWLFDTENGELDELNFYPWEFSLVRKISADSSFVLKDTNPYKYYEFIVKARAKAQKSNIVVINHSLLLQDLINDNSIFGNIENLIIDEAHNLEDSATDAFKKIINIKIIDDTFNFLEKFNQKQNKIQDFSIIKESFLFNFTMLFETFSSYFTQKQFGNKNKEFLLEDDFFSNFGDLSIFLKSLESSYEKLVSLVLELDDKIAASIETELSTIGEAIDTLRIILNKENKSKYIKVVGSNEKTGTYCYYTLLNPGDYLRQNMWEKLNSCILTSATLRVGENFSYIEKILCLKDIFTYHYFQSDFDYSKQALLFIPNDLGKIKNNNTALITEFLEKLFKIVKGRSMVLFTSYQSIKDTYVGLNSSLKKEGIEIFAQSISGSKHKLLQQFRKKRASGVLFGTDSFWEGIDIAGGDLETLVIYKFPFDPPTDPVFLARSKLFVNSFSDYSIPKAIIRLKQGFGRLIRTKTDKGIVILLDDRIHSTTWGENMFLAFPENINKKIGNSQNFLEVLAKKEK